MSRWMLVLPVLFVLYGCAAVPGTESSFSDTKATAGRTYDSRLSAMAAAKCAVRNLDERMPKFTAAISPESPRPGIIEIRAKSEVGFAAIVEVAPKDGGSVMTTWISNHYPMKGILTNLITEGC